MVGAGQKEVSEVTWEVLVQVVTLTEEWNTGKGVNLEGEVIEKDICRFWLPSIHPTSFYPWYFNFPLSTHPILYPLLKWLRCN